MVPRLSDGIELDALKDEEARSLSARIFYDEEIFRLEQERIFAGSWIPLAHESEVGKPGDYVRRSMGLDQVIVSRDHEGRLHVMLNSCAHRGMQICREDSGSARTLVCPYHGWAYGIDGSLAGAPHEEEIYGRRLDRKEFVLKKARVETFGGWIFATWNEGAPSLMDFIGDHRWYMEMLLCRTDNGQEVVGPPQRFVINSNWKLIVENFSADHGHIGTTHRSLQEIGLFPEARGHHSTTSNHNGHSMLHNPQLDHEPVPGGPLETLRAFPPSAMTPELVEQLPKHLSEDQLWVLANRYPSTGAIFPCMAWVVFQPFPAGEELSSVFTFRLFAPITPDETECLSFTLAEKDTSEAFKRLVARATTHAFGPAGVFEADDIENWTGMQRSLGGVMNRHRRHFYPAVREPNAEGWPGPGEVHQGTWCDSVQWNFYRKYFETMAGQV
jgi:phenylpropionate dioxygenase-like ring-hydroxylating dioxygenase large terminal subunit